MDHRLVEQVVETLCAAGCRAVWTTIDDLEAGREIPEVRDLSPQEIKAVISELKAVMAVYEGTCAAG